MDRDVAGAVFAPEAEKGRLNIGHVLLVASGHLVHDTFSAFLNPLLPLIIDKLSLSLTLAGSLVLFSRLPSLFNPFIGQWADRIDLRLLVILAPAATAIVMSLIGLAPSYALLALLLLIAGVSSAALHVPGPVIVSRVSGKRVGLGMSVWMMAGELARTVGPLFAVTAVSWWTLEGYYPVMLLGVVTSLFLFWRLRGITIQQIDKGEPTPLRQSWRSLRRLMLPLTAFMLFRAMFSAAMTTFLPTYLTLGGQSLWFGGAALAVVEFAGALGALAAGTLSDRIDRRLVLLVSMLSAPLLFLLSMALSGGMQLTSLALTGFTVLSTSPVILAMVQEYGRDYPATANGIYMGISFLISAGAAPLLGWVGDNVGLNTAFFWSALLALFCVPFVLLLPGRKDRLSSSR